MAKFKVTVTRVDEYEIECNYSPEQIKEYSEHFSTVETEKDIAKVLAVDWMRNEDKYFIEGFGYVKEFRKDGSLNAVYIHDGNYILN